MTRIDAPAPGETPPETPPSLVDDPVRSLRRRWKPTKERLAQCGDHPSNVRFHRACSWLQRSLAAWEQDDYDAALVFAWTCLNALYGRWDRATNQPEKDRDGYDRFFDRLRQIDHGDRLVSVLQEEKPLVLSIVEDAYLNRHFWNDPDSDRGRRPDRVAFKVRSAYYEGAWTQVLAAVLDRIYLLRCQVVHGAATSGSRLNRDGLRRCARLLHLLSQAALEVFIDGGVGEDWGELCYPPMH